MLYNEKGSSLVNQGEPFVALKSMRIDKSKVLICKSMFEKNSSYAEYSGIGHYKSLRFIA